MASTSVVVGRTWTQIDTGPDTVNVQPERKRCQIFVNDTTPPATEFGITINPEDFRLIELESGENLYARSIGGNVNITVTD